MENSASEFASSPLRVLAWPRRTAGGNPYTRLLYEHLEERGVVADEFGPARVLTGAYDVWHIHWPDGAFRKKSGLRAGLSMAAVIALMTVARRRGIKIVWTVHNVGGHDARPSPMERWFWQAFMRRLDGVISLSRAGLAAAQSAFPALRSVPAALVPHGHYRDAYPARVPRADARARLDLPAREPVVAFFGSIRPYKNVKRLIEVFRGLGDDEAALLVAGRPQTPALEQRLRATAAEAENVHLRLGFIPDDEVPAVMGAADLVALPYTDILNSGSALLALSVDRPVLVPAKGAMSELQAQVGGAWVRTYDGALTAETLRAALRWAQETERAEHAPLEPFAWNEIARQTKTAYEAVLRRRRDGETRSR